MKTISIRQPYAWAIMAGIKPVENRTWSTSYRGPLAIHAGKAWYDDERFDRIELACWCKDYGREFPNEIDLGGIVGVVDLVDVVSEHPSNFFNGPYGWVLANPRSVEFIPMKGRLGLFEIDDKLIRAIGGAA